MYYDPFQLILGKSPHHDKKKNHKKKILTEEQLKKIKIKKLKEKIKLKKKKKIEDAKHKHLLIEDNINLEKEKPDNNVYINNNTDIEYGDEEDFNDPKKLKEFEKEYETIFVRDNKGKIQKDKDGIPIIIEDQLKVITDKAMLKYPLMRFIYKQALTDADLED